MTEFTPTRQLCIPRWNRVVARAETGYAELPALPPILHRVRVELRVEPESRPLRDPPRDQRISLPTRAGTMRDRGEDDRPSRFGW